MAGRHKNAKKSQNAIAEQKPKNGPSWGRKNVEELFRPKTRGSKAQGPEGAKERNRKAVEKYRWSSLDMTEAEERELDEAILESAAARGEEMAKEWEKHNPKRAPDWLEDMWIRDATDAEIEAEEAGRDFEFEIAMDQKRLKIIDDTWDQLLRNEPRCRDCGYLKQERTKDHTEKAEEFFLDIHYNYAEKEEYEEKKYHAMNPYKCAAGFCTPWNPVKEPRTGCGACLKLLDDGEKWYQRKKQKLEEDEMKTKYGRPTLTSIINHEIPWKIVIEHADRNAECATRATCMTNCGATDYLQTIARKNKAENIKNFLDNKEADYDILEHEAYWASLGKPLDAFDDEVERIMLYHEYRDELDYFGGSEDWKHRVARDRANAEVARLYRIWERQQWEIRRSSEVCRCRKVR